MLAREVFIVPLAVVYSKNKKIFKQALQCSNYGLCMYHGGLHAYFNRRQASPSTAASGPQKTSGPGQAPPALDLGVR